MTNYRVWHIQNLPNAPVHYYVTGPEQAAQVIFWLIELDLMRKDVESNAFGLEQRIGVTDDGKEWEEWEDENGSIVDKVDKQCSQYEMVRYEP